MNENKKVSKETTTFKKIRLPFIMSIITLCIGLFLSYDLVGFPIKQKPIILLMNFIPFIIFLIIILIIYKNKQKTRMISTLRVASIIIACLSLFYYFYVVFFTALEEVMNPVTNPKYYTMYVSGSRLYKIFPKKIPDNVENVAFFYAPGVLQGGTNYSLYYVDKSMTMEKFDNEYKEKAIWIGRKSEYTEKRGLLTGVFSFTPISDIDRKAEDDYIIYLIEGRCDDSGYCNHGDFLVTAFNEETNEVIFRSEQW